MHPAVERLIRLLAPPPAGDRIDWARAEMMWGTPFPADYRDFVSVFGGGSINNSFHIGVPVGIDTSAPRRPLTFRELTDDGQYLAEQEDTAAEGISWATDCQADYLFWETSAGVPDEWTVFVVDRSGERTDFDCGMVEFLVAVLAGEITPMPVALFDPETPVFVRRADGGA